MLLTMTNASLLLQPDLVAVAVNTIALGLVGLVGILDDCVLLLAFAIFARRLAFDIA